MTKQADIAVQVLASVDARGDWSPVTLELLGDARGLSQRCGGRVGAWVLAAPGAAEPDMATLARHGCDALLRLIHPRFSAWEAEAAAAALAATVPTGCRLILLPGTSHGEEAAALLAESLGVTWIPDALTLSMTRTGALEVTSVAHGGKLARTFRDLGQAFQPDRQAFETERQAGKPDLLHGPLLVTMRPGVAEVRKRDGAGALEVHELPVDVSSVACRSRIAEFLPADPKTIDLSLARRVVAAGRGAGGPEGLRLAAELAEALHASVGASRMAVDLGWAPPERQVGQTGKTVKPDLYVACGISGASHHLAGMRESRHIVAINTDSAAPIHQVAHLSLCGDLHELIPAIVAHLAHRRTEPPPPFSPPRASAG